MTHDPIVAAVNMLDSAEAVQQLITESHVAYQLRSASLEYERPDLCGRRVHRCPTMDEQEGNCSET